MIPMLEALANTVSALPAVGSAAQSFSSVRGAGGFAATLAAAQGESTTPQNGSSNGRGPDSNGSASGGSTNATLGLTNNFNVRAAASENAQLRKSTGNSGSNNSLAVALAGAAAVNSPLPQPIAMTAVPLVPAISIGTTAPLAGTSTQPSLSLPNLLPSNEPPASFSQTSVQQSSPEQASALRPTVAQSGPLQAGFSATPVTVSSAAQASAGAAGSIQPTVAAGEFGVESAAIPSASVSNAGVLNSVPNPASPSSASGVFTATGVSGESTTQQIPAGTAPATSSSPDPANQSASTSWNGLQNNWGSAEPVVLAENAPPSLSSSAFGQVSSSPLSAQNQTANATTSSSNSLANVFPETVPQPGLPSSSDSGQPGGSNASNDGTEGNGTASFPIAGNVAAPIPNASTPDAQTSSAAVLNLAAQMLASKAPLPFAAPQLPTAPSSTTVRAATGRQSAPGSTLTAAAGSDSATTLPIAGQTPFSVFFSNAGPGTESAASALPKIVTPVTASAIHLPNSSAAGTQGVSASQASSQSAASQNPSAKDASSGTNSGNSPAAQAAHRETDPSVTGFAVAASQAAALPASAPPAASGMAASPVALAADSVAKPDAAPAPAPESPVIMAPAPPPTLPTATLGPVQVAQMMSRLGQSEMRIGMSTSAFGTVDVRTVIHASDVGLVIGSEKGDLRGLMTSEMPGISNSLQQQNLRLNSVSFMQGFASPGNGNGSSGGNSQQQFLASQRGSSSLLPEPVDNSADTASASEYGSSRGLSILA